ncbi:MAG: formate/nitrite transporter family protein [Acidobacteria bacterium]|jgi:formate/nitrite transporter|nr:formate/nitrite transporter family protein [Acidobacteriota bacterium]
MDYTPPSALRDALDQAARKKAALSVRSLLLTGFLSGALLAFATAFAFKVSNALPEALASLIAGLVFPVGFAMIVLLGTELATGNFAVLAFGLVRGQLTGRALLRNWAWVYGGNFLGSVCVGALLAVALTEAFLQSPGLLGARLVDVADKKTHFYAHAGLQGWLTALVKGILCNWMVTLGSVLGFSSSSTTGKIAAIWLPISIFFALALEHSIVNMFVIPTAMMLGADIGLTDWLWWNQVPVTLGNIVGGAVFTGLLLHYAQPGAPAAS